MSLEERVLTLFAEGNPVPDLDDLERVDIEAAAYLAILEQRSSEVTQLDDKKLKKETRKRPNMSWPVAAAAVIVLGVAIFLLSRGNEDAPVVTEPPPTTIGEPVPQESSLDGYWASGPIEVFFEEDRYAILISGRLSDQGTYVETDGEIRMTSSGGGSCNLGELSVMVIDVNEAGELQMALTEDCGTRPALRDLTLSRSAPFEVPEPLDPEEAEWQALPLQEPAGGFEAGATYRTGSFYAPAAYTIPNDSWQRIGESSEFVWLCREPDDVANCQAAIWLFNPLTSNVDEAVQSLTSQPGPSFSEPEPAEIGGSAGLRFDVSSEEGAHILHEFSNTFDQLALHIGEQARGYVVNVAGTPVGVYVFSTDDGAYFDETQELLDSIIWKDLR